MPPARSSGPKRQDMEGRALKVNEAQEKPRPEQRAHPPLVGRRMLRRKQCDAKRLEDSMHPQSSTSNRSAGSQLASIADRRVLRRSSCHLEAPKHAWREIESQTSSSTLRKNGFGSGSGCMR